MTIKSRLLIPAALITLSFGVSGSALQPLTDRIDIVSANKSGLVVGLPNSNPPPRNYHRGPGTIHMPPDPVMPPGPIMPPDPCRRLARKWVKVIMKNKSAHWKRKKFTKLLRKMAKKNCRVDIQYADQSAPATGPSDVDALTVKPVIE